MASEYIQDTVKELREMRTVIEQNSAGKDQRIHQLEIRVQALTAELESVNTYYSGINELLDRLSTVKGAPQQQRLALQILQLRDRKNGLKKVPRSEE